jgi:hypothetical protein
MDIQQPLNPLACGQLAEQTYLGWVNRVKTIRH